MVSHANRESIISELQQFSNKFADDFFKYVSPIFQNFIFDFNQKFENVTKCLGVHYDDTESIELFRLLYLIVNNYNSSRDLTVNDIY